MDDLDRRIEEALSVEDRAILEKFGEQIVKNILSDTPGHFGPQPLFSVKISFSEN